MDSEELLAQLADIHLPGAISYWPPAPGWWILALIALIALALLVRKAKRYRTQQNICQYALAELDACYARYTNTDNGNLGELKLRFVNQFNSVLRRVALVHFPQANVASLGGAAWVDFIRQNSESSLLDEEISAALQYGRFQTQCDVDVDAMLELGHQWISTLYLAKSAAIEPRGVGANA